MTLKISVVLGSVRDGRQGIRVAEYMENFLKERGHEVTLIDPKNYDIPLLENRLKYYGEKSPPEDVLKISKIFEDSDAIVVVSPEYNHSIPPALSNTLDYFLDEFKHKVSGIVCYSNGQFGGMRVAMQLRIMLSVLGMPSIPYILSIPYVEGAFNEDGTPKWGKISSEARKFSEELEWFGEALKAKRELR